MAFAVALAVVQEEASCPICLDHLRDPVTTECGHNFCASCIHQRWEGLQGTFPCPVCLHHCHDRSLKRNTQLCHMTENVQQIPTIREKRKRQEEPLCKKHHEILALFCQKDLQLLCAQCRVSSDHRDHPLIPIEEASDAHRKKLKSCIESLSEQIKGTENRSELQVSECSELRQKIETQKDELQFDFKDLKRFLEKENIAMLMRFINEITNIQDKVIEENNQISKHSSLINSLFSDINKCLQTDVDLFTVMKSIYNRFANLETPAMFSYELKNESFKLPPHYLGLHKMICTFQVDLTLDPQTAHPSLIISSDRRSVNSRTSLGPYNPQAHTSYPAVLSSEGFDAGRHYWQVEIGGTGAWSLGVCKESFPRNTLISPSPRNGCWQIQLWVHTSVTCHSVNWERIGIFLDYELGEVSFYNLRNKSHLYTFSGDFTEKLMPYFCLGPSSKPLVMRIVNDE